MKKIDSVYEVIPTYKIKLKKIPNRRRKRVTNAKKATRYFKRIFDVALDDYVESIVIVMLDVKLRPIAFKVLSTGTENSSLWSPRELFINALLLNAHAIIVCHNHPSGDVTPSKNDEDIYEQMKKAGELLRIDVVDSIIIDTVTGNAYSMKEGGIVCE